MIREKCISYQFLCDKLWSNLAAKSNKYLLSHGFYGSDIWTWLSQVPDPQSLSQDKSMCLPGLPSHLKAWLEKGVLPSSLTWLSAGSSCSSLELGFGLRASVPHLLLAEDPPQFLATWASPQGSSKHDHLLGPSKQESPRKMKTIVWSDISSPAPHAMH